MKVLFVLIIVLFLEHELFAQQISFPDGIYTSWKKLKDKKPIPNTDSFYFKERSMKEVRITGGNDYEITSKTFKSIPKKRLKNIFAVVLHGIVFINGNNISLSNHFCKALLISDKLIFLGAIPPKQRNHYDELIAIYGATGGFEQRFVADLNEQRHVYYLDMNKRKSKVIRVTKYTILNILKLNPQASKTYMKEADPENNAVLLKYLKIGYSK